MIAIAAMASILILASMGCVVFVVKVMLTENRALADKAELAHLASSSREQMAYMTAVSQITGIVTDAFDHLQSKTAAESAEVAHLRAQSSVTVRSLQDELASAQQQKRVIERPKIKAMNGQEYSPEEIEIA